MSGLMLKVAGGLALLLVAASTSAERLGRDPFRPPAELLAKPATTGGVALSPVGEPVIRGILLAGDQSLVNLGGKLLGIGESADGYRLLHVTEAHAVFQRGDQVVTLKLYPDQKDAG